MFSDQLVEKIINGDTEAQHILMKKMTLWTKKVLTKKKFYASGYTSEDLIQEALLGVFKSLEGYNASKGQFGPFIKKVAINSILLIVQKKNANKEKIFHGSESFDRTITSLNDDGKEKNLHDVLSSTTQTPENYLLTQEKLDEFKHFMKENFSEREKIIFSLKLEGYTYIEIAKKLNITKKSINNSVQRINRKIKKYKEERKDYV
jgi:RNA polymerase sporulation-specific sigma factor